LPHIERNGNTIRVHGKKGSYLFDTSFGPGIVGAHPYGGPGGTYWYELALYERGDELVFVATCVEKEYGEARSDTVYVSRDGGLDFLPVWHDSSPYGTLVQRIDMQ
jgi:hypothetical protein